MDFGPFGRSTRTLARALAGVGLPLLMYACGHGPTPAGPVAAWLDEQGKLWAFSRAWRDGVADDPTGEKAFERVMGATPAAMNAAW